MVSSSPRAEVARPDSGNAPVSRAAGWPSPRAAKSESGNGPRLFATYGGTTLDVSYNDGMDWSRAVEGAEAALASKVTHSKASWLYSVCPLL
jgi:hypothetical protein